MADSLGEQLRLLVERLKERQNELKRLDAGSVEARSPVELDQSRQGRLSRMDALQGQAMAMETARRRELELKKIEAALARIQDGDYGYCLRCGESIGHKRLEFDPATPLCVDCANEAGSGTRH
ncbi:TraR/DksA family transcriptional regulator [Limibacillus halophilus]|jgi:DnaK suppressor protein